MNNEQMVSVPRCRQRDVHRGFSYWHDMIRRTTAVNRLKNSSYENAYVCEEWTDFDVFSGWFIEQIKMPGWVLDKDLLASGVKIYSPETCCFIPREINQMLVCSRKDSGGFPGVYRRGSKFAARVKARNKRIHIGTYDTPEDALSSYLSVKAELLSNEAEEYRVNLDPRAYMALKTYDFKRTLEIHHD